MPSKRPAPLSDSALFTGRAGSAPVVEVVTGPLGETNDGVPLPVKNTFIDVPSGLTPTMQTQSRAQMLNTAPAELNFTPGFIKRAVLASSAVGPKTSVEISPKQIVSPAVGSKTSVDGLGQPVPGSSSSPRQRGGIGVPVQRPTKEVVPVVTPAPSTLGCMLPASLQTPSPTGNTLFSSCRYQLFGGPAPVQEASHSAFGNVAAPAAVLLSQSTVVSSEPDISGKSSATCSRTLTSTERLPESLVKERECEDDEDDSDLDEEMLKQAQKPLPGVTRAEDAPKPPPGAAHPSLGSDTHDEGTCKRCCFFPRNRCLNGYNCEFCHYDHEKRKRKSKKKKKKDKEGASVGVEATGLLVGPPTQLVGSAYHHIAENSLYAPSSIPPSHLSSQAVPSMSTHVWVDGLPSSYPPPALPFPGVEQVGGCPQVPATVSSPSYFAAATGSAIGSEVDSVQYLGTQPVVPPNHYMGHHPPPELWSTGLHDPWVFPPPYEDPLAYLPIEVPPCTLATTPAMLGPWAPPFEAPPSLSAHTLTLATTPAPPSEAPRLHDVPVAKEMAPPTEAPRAFPPTPQAPPPMSSPKLPKDFELSLREAGILEEEEDTVLVPDVATL